MTKQTGLRDHDSLIVMETRFVSLGRLQCEICGTHTSLESRPKATVRMAVSPAAIVAWILQSPVPESMEQAWRTSAAVDPIITAALVLLILLIPFFIYRIYFTSYGHIPAIPFSRLTSLTLHAICYFGIEGRVLRHYHLRYNTKLLLVAPNSLSVSDPAAIRDIYITAGGYCKDDRYKNFNLGPVVSIFSAIDTEYRNTRAKAVAPLFAPSRLRAASQKDGVIGSSVAEFVHQFRAFKQAGVRVDILDLCARLSIDVVTGYLLGEKYGGLSEHAHFPVQSTERQEAKLSANPFIMAIVAFSRFSLLPNWVFKLLYSLFTRLNEDKKVVTSFVKLEQWLNRVMSNIPGALSSAAKAREEQATSSYQARLLQAGIPPAETSAQCKAIVFAGADSTAVMLATILFHLAQAPNVRERLLSEIRGGTEDVASQDPQSLPYLRAVVREGLRLGMANPTRLTRIVPASSSGADFIVDGVRVLPGTVIGSAAYMLHHDPEVFPDPFAFRPARWLRNENGSHTGERSLDGADDGESLHRPKMDGSMIPFGAGLRACIGKTLALQQLYEAVFALIDSEVLDEARTVKQRIERKEWFNGEIKGHKLEIDWGPC